MCLFEKEDQSRSLKEEAHIVTTPHGCKPEASGMTRVCRPTPIVRFMPHARDKLKTTHALHGTIANTEVFLPKHLLPGTSPKHFSVVYVQKNSMQSNRK